MPFETKWDEREFYTRFWGEVLDSEIERKNKVFSGDPRCEKCYYKVFDATEVEAFLFSENDITKYASNDIGMSAYVRNLSVVLIGSKTEVRSVFQRYVSTCLRVHINWKFHLCDTLEQAREWINQQEKRRLKVLVTTSEANQIDRTPH